MIYVKYITIKVGKKYSKRISMKLKQVIICFSEQKEMEKTETEVAAIYTLFLYHEKFSHSVVADSLRAHGLQHARLPCPSQTPRACSNSCTSVSDAIQLSHPLSSTSLLSSIFPSIRVFSNESVLRIRWPKYWSFSFSISPFNEYSGLISFRMDIIWKSKKSDS